MLYFGAEKWESHLSLKAELTIPDELKPLVDDVEVNLYQIAFLSEEEVKYFHSDFRYVADYFRQMRVNKKYTPGPDTVKHADAILKMMSALTHDTSFEEAIPAVEKLEGDVSMERVFDTVKNSGKEEVAEKMIIEGKLSDSDIRMYTGFSQEKLDKIRKELLQKV